MTMILALLAATAATQAAPSAPDPVAAEALDPARLAAARTLIDVIMPADTREGMIDAMLRPMMTNLTDGITGNPAFAKVFADPKMRAVFDRFIARQNDLTLTKLRTGMPGMFAAMERAYARRFTVQQMADAAAFFRTPSGRVFMREGMTIMSDPDIQAWQRTLMQQSMGSMQDSIAQLVAEIEAAEKTK